MTTDDLSAQPSPAAAIDRRWWCCCLLPLLLLASSLLWQQLANLPELLQAAWSAGTTPQAQRIQRASGLSPELVATMQQVLQRSDRLLVYSPYGGSEFELDANDPRGELARQVRILFERCKNLLYPYPRDVRFARDPAELLRQLQDAEPGRCYVLDGTQDPAPLQLGGRHELLLQAAVGGAALRFWRYWGAG